MNNRAQLVDSWRQIAVSANSLLGTFNIEYHLSSLSPPGLDHPFAFTGSRTRNQLVFNGELPLVRIVQRNNYRAALLNWERQRRLLMGTEDTIVAGVRSQLRALRVLTANYLIQQRAVELAYLQVENALDTFRAPPVPSSQPLGAANVAGAGNNAALTQQLLEAQNNLVRAQNSLVTVWVQYLTTRMQLYRDFELMPLDPRGVWTDDVATCQCLDSSPSTPAEQRPGDAEPAPAPRKVEAPKPGVPVR
jgi:outer membrane protein TolC